MSFFTYKATDYALDENGDLAIVDGDFVLEESDNFHIQDILIAQKGSFRFYPTLGVGLDNFLNSPIDSRTKNTLAKEIRKNLEQDNFKLRALIISDALEISIDAYREK